MLLMSRALLDLENVFRFQRDKITPQEANALLMCETKIFNLREFWIGALIGASGTWAATPRLSKISRVCISGGAGAYFGLWRFGRSLDSCVNHILAMDGTRMQKELANIIVKKYQDDPWTVQRLLYKHFYTERVLDDSSSNMLILRWRHRNFFGDNVASDQRMDDNDSQADSHNDSESKKADTESKQIPARVLTKIKAAAADVAEDPLDSIFGYKTQVEEIQHPSATSKPTKVPTRSHKRSHRRRRMHHHGAP